MAAGVCTLGPRHDMAVGARALGSYMAWLQELVPLQDAGEDRQHLDVCELAR